MKEKIEQLAKEKFEYQMPKLCIEPEKLIIRTQEGSAHRGTILLTNSAGRRMKGVAYTDNLLLALEKEQFVGREARIPFVFHAEYGKAGDHLAGKLSFVTDAGEETLPYEVQIDYPALSANGEDIKDLFSLQALRKGTGTQRRSCFLTAVLRRLFSTMTGSMNSYTGYYQKRAGAGRQWRNFWLRREKGAGQPAF